MYENEQFLFEALKAGASGYVLKSGADDDIAEACRAAMRGHSFLYPSVVDTLIRDFIERADTRGNDFELLTPRELEVLKLIAEGHTSKEIATMLVISIKTVDRHRTNMLENSACATASISPATRSAAASSSPERSAFAASPHQPKMGASTRCEAGPAKAR